MEHLERRTILGHKANLCRRTEIQIMFSDHNRIKLKRNNKSMFRMSQNIWKLNKILLNFKAFGEKITKVYRKYFL